MNPLEGKDISSYIKFINETYYESIVDAVKERPSNMSKLDVLKILKGDLESGKNEIKNFKDKSFKKEFGVSRKDIIKSAEDDIKMIDGFIQKEIFKKEFSFRTYNEDVKKAMKELPPYQKDIVMDNALQFFKSRDLGKGEKVAITKALVQVVKDASIRGQGKQVEDLLKEWMRGAGKLSEQGCYADEIIKGLTGFSSFDEIDTTSEHAKPFYNSSLMDLEKLEIILALHKIPEEKIKTITKNVLNFSNDKTTGFEMSLILCLFAYVSEDKHEAMVKLGGDKTNFKEKIELINAHSKAGSDLEEWTRCILLLLLMKEKFNAKHPPRDVNIIRIIKYLAEENFEGLPYPLIELMTSLFLSDRTIDASVIQNSRNFIKEEMSVYEAAEVIGFIESIPEDERQPVVESASSLGIFHEGMSWREQAHLLSSIVEIPLAERKDKLEEAKHHFTGDMEGMEKAMIIRCLSIEDGLKGIEKIKNRSLPYEFEEDIEADFTLPFVSISPDSIFANTDLIVFQDDFKGVLPLNGIKKSELLDMEKLARSIFAGEKNIKIDFKNPKYKEQIQNDILTLLTRPMGREIIKKIIDHPKNSGLPIRQGDVCRVHREPLFVEINPIQHFLRNVFSEDGREEKRSYYQPSFVILGHELIHVLHHLSGSLDKNKMTMPTEGDEYTHLEEQITITGFSQKSPIESFEGFSALNERNLHAAFANLKSGFDVRYGHRGKPVRADIAHSFDPIGEGRNYLSGKIKEEVASYFRELGLTAS